MRRMFALWVVVGLASTSVLLSQEASRSDPFEQGIRAIQSRDYEKAIELLGRVPEDHPQFKRAMLLAGHDLCGRTLEKPLQGLPFVERIYAKAPDDMEVAKAYIDIMVLSGKAFPAERPSRTHAKEAKPEFQHLTRKFEGLARTRTFRRETLEEDLDFLEVRLDHCYSYLERRGIDYKGALDAVRLSLQDETPLAQFIVRVAMLFCLFGDAHSRFAIDTAAFLPGGYSPFQAASCRGRVVAFNLDWKGLADADCPYLAAIDGIPLERWLAVANRIVPQGSRQLIERERLEALMYLAFHRQELGLPAGSGVELELESLDRGRRKSVTIPLETARSPMRPLRRKVTPRLGEFGYLRIARMDSDPGFLAGLDARMAEFKDTEGLIIDVRDNGGGTQDALRTLLPYFLKPGDPIQIVNVAAYRLPIVLPKPNPSGFLGLHGRGLHPVTSAVWARDEADAIREFLQSFRPSWVLPAGKFSDWHVMAVHPRTNRKAYPYEGHVCILSNVGSFSATDNFLGAFKGRPNVTVVGTPSGGGSGRMQDYRMKNTGLQFTLSQMASYARTGQLYDGHGVDPDVVVEAEIEDYMGGGDAVLDAAVRVLQERCRKREPVPVGAEREF